MLGRSLQSHTRTYFKQQKQLYDCPREIWANHGIFVMELWTIKKVMH